LINKQWVYAWKSYTYYKIFKKFFCEKKILDYLDHICLDEEKFLDEENFEKCRNEFYRFISDNNLILNSSEHPGEINNYKLLKKIDQDDSEYSVFPENYVLVKINSLDILSIIGEKQWSFFFSNFSGGPCIQRQLINYLEENQKLKIETNHLVVLLIIYKTNLFIHLTIFSFY
jgi:hypothetical protein